jgi:4a-hydroxytetrahydrobiopterin dehydratase
MAELLEADAIRASLAGLPDWTGNTEAIVRTVELGSFADAIATVNRVAAVAEELDHHPDIDIRWRTVTFSCATHAAGGVTERDFALARRIDDILRGGA